MSFRNLLFFADMKLTLQNYYKCNNNLSIFSCNKIIITVKFCISYGKNYIKQEEEEESFYQ